MTNSTLQVADLKKYDELDYINMIWFGIMKMEPVLLELLLDDKINYQDIGKEQFIDRLRNRFEFHRREGDTELKLDLDSCSGCNCNQPVCKFIGNNSGKHFALYFEMDRDQINDIYHCNWYGDTTFDGLF